MNYKGTKLEKLKEMLNAKNPDPYMIANYLFGIYWGLENKIDKIKAIEKKLLQSADEVDL